MLPEHRTTNSPIFTGDPIFSAGNRRSQFWDSIAIAVWLRSQSPVLGRPGSTQICCPKFSWLKPSLITWKIQLFSIWVIGNPHPTRVKSTYPLCKRVGYIHLKYALKSSSTPPKSQFPSSSESSQQLEVRVVAICLPRIFRSMFFLRCLEDHYSAATEVYVVNVN